MQAVAGSTMSMDIHKLMFDVMMSEDVIPVIEKWVACIGDSHNPISILFDSHGGQECAVAPIWACFRPISHRVSAINVRKTESAAFNLFMHFDHRYAVEAATFLTHRTRIRAEKCDEQFKAFSKWMIEPYLNRTIGFVSQDIQRMIDNFALCWKDVLAFARSADEYNISLLSNATGQSVDSLMPWFESGASISAQQAKEMNIVRAIYLDVSESNVQRISHLLV
jgi:hypothetical protein